MFFKPFVTNLKNTRSYSEYWGVLVFWGISIMFCSGLAHADPSLNPATASHDKNAANYVWFEHEDRLSLPSIKPSAGDEDDSDETIHVPKDARAQPIIDEQDMTAKAVKPESDIEQEKAPVSPPSAPAALSADDENAWLEDDMAAVEETLNAPQSEAEDIFLQALAQTFKDNPTLKAQRESARLAYEKVFEAKTGWLPHIDGDASITGTAVESDLTGHTDTTTKAAGITLSQPIYQSGRTNYAIDRQTYTAQSAYYGYLDTVQDVLLAYIVAYIDVVTAKSQLDFNTQNVKRLEQQNDATLQEFEVGLLTRTDVSQSEARLAEARSGLIRAQGLLEQRLARFEEVAGRRFAQELYILPDQVFSDLLRGILPHDLQESERLALAQHPLRLAAELDIMASEANIDANRSALFPEISLNGSVAHRDDDGLAGVNRNEQTSASIGLTASFPLYNAGLTRSRIRQAKVQTFSARHNHEAVERTVSQNVKSVWQDYKTAQAVLTSTEAQLAAARTAREGVYSEREVGARTVLDALDADQELLNAQLEHLTAQRDLLVAKFSLLEATGQLTAESLSLQPLFTDEIKRQFTQVSLSNLFSTNVKSMDNY